MKSTRIICLTLMIAAMCAIYPIIAHAVDLDKLVPVLATQEYGQLQAGKSVNGGPLRIGDRTFIHGLGTHARSDIVYDLDRQYKRLSGWVGIDAEMKDYTSPSVIFKVLGDGHELYSSGVMRLDTPAKQFDISVEKVAELTLVVEDAGDGITCDHADWGEPVLTGTPRANARAPMPKPKYSVHAPGIILKLSERGEICGVILGNIYHPMTGRTGLRGCEEDRAVKVRKLTNQGMEFVHSLSHGNPAEQCLVTERFTPTRDSIHWELEISGKGAPWSAPIITRISWPETQLARFWTAWGDPEISGIAWNDPLTAKPFSGKSRWIGVPPGGGNYTGTDAVSIPIASILIPSSDSGLSLVLSPEDLYLETALTTGDSGSIALTRISHRISSTHKIKFNADLVPHKGDWRVGLGWMANRYPAYFNPPNPVADDMAGCGAYSTFEGDLDVARYKKMSFRVNWKASFDFPYIGMFLPPVASDTEKWPRFDADSGGNIIKDLHTETSIAQMSAYSKKMRDEGFHVLNYFNVTEMGTGMHAAPGPEMKADDPYLWRDPRQFVAHKLKDAVLVTENGGELSSWGDAIILDCGVPSYQDYLIDQAKRHIEKLPASSGICIDRMDWLRYYSQNGDDGVSWRGRPLRAMTEAWKSTMNRLGPLMHTNGKVIFVNALLGRLDLMKQIDGVYHEFGGLGPCLNAAAFLCVRKPAIVWTGDSSPVLNEPDNYFQRHLYLGVYPTAPFPGNDHTLLPSEAVDKWYLDYGPLMDQMRGKKWVLEPHVITVEGNAKANLFEVPGGYVAPVMLGGKTEVVQLIVRRPSKLKKWPAIPTIQAFYPGNDQPVTLARTIKGDRLHLTVPLQRGCAMVRITLP